MLNTVIHGDCFFKLKDVPKNSVDLIVTSPPYAQQRERTYGGIEPKDYARWFLPRAEEFYRILKPTGSFVLNIKENVQLGERHIYVQDLIVRLVYDDWKWMDEFIW